MMVHDSSDSNRRQLAHVDFKIAKMEQTVKSELLTEGMTKEDYVLVGDIIELIPAGNVNPCYCAFVTVSGVVNKVDTESHIELCPYVYNYLLKDSNAPKPSMPICTFYPDTPRWTHKPKVSSRTYVSVSGFLHSIVRTTDGMADHFEVELEKVTFLGRPFVPTGKTPATPPAGISSLAGKRLCFSYADGSPSNKKTTKTTMPQPQPQPVSVAHDSAWLQLVDESSLFFNSADFKATRLRLESTRVAYNETGKVAVLGIGMLSVISPFGNWRPCAEPTTATCGLLSMRASVGSGWLR
ncbi:hypothetical protein K435DRAFT_800809 [Dendrothele bispora CBS 962.96]|uniref:Uncharacterized protein n=1 Tax=Dendrothele bispora (strain CBS 962.96) TaxID=1314807 RepID=A0A4S8LRA4_DENBC|nr:hypothetical protein K435DRAFT_800809 [Dendrothele bispora CBS 962.96]